MPLLPAALVNHALPLFRPLRRAVKHGWVREDVFDYYGRWFHPQLQLNRVFAKVVARRDEGDSSVAYTLAPSANWQTFAAGQHVTVTVEFGGVRHTRRYSPSQIAEGQIEITVKRQADGLVSNWMYQHVNVGSYVELGQPEGELVLPATLPSKLLLLAAGSGITPMLAMIRELRARHYAGDVVLVYYGQHRSNLAHLAELKATAGLVQHVCLTQEAPAAGEHAGRFSAAQLDQLVPDAADRHAFACGAFGFTRSIAEVWRTREWPNLAVESFSPPVWQFDDNQPITLTFTQTNKKLAGHTGGTLLEQAEALGLKPAFGCRMGICNTCSCHKREGAVRDLRTGHVSIEPDETIRLCISAPMGDVTLDL